MFAILPYKKETARHCLLTLRENCCSFRSPKIIKLVFEAAVVSAVNKAFPDSVIKAVIFLLISARGNRYKVFALTLEYEENEQVRLTCRMCDALAHQPISRADEVWLMIMENVQQKEKMTLFLDFVEHWMENQNVEYS